MFRKHGKESVTEDDFEPAPNSRGKTSNKTSGSKTRSKTTSRSSSTAMSNTTGGASRSRTTSQGTTAAGNNFKRIQRLLDGCEGNGDLYSECGCFPYMVMFVMVLIGVSLASLTVLIDFHRIPL